MKAYLGTALLVLLCCVFGAWGWHTANSQASESASVSEEKGEIEVTEEKVSEKETIFPISDELLAGERAAYSAAQDACKAKKAEIEGIVKAIELNESEIPKTEKSAHEQELEFGVLQKHRTELLQELTEATPAAPPAEGQAAEGSQKRSIEAVQAELGKLAEQFTARQQSLKELNEKLRLAKESLANQYFNLKWAEHEARILESMLKFRKARCEEVEQMFLLYGRSRTSAPASK